MNQQNTQSHKLSGFAKFRKEWIEPIVFALILAGIIRTFIIQPFKIPSGSMEDTLLIGDHLMATKFTYGIKLPFTDIRILKFRNPQPGDIIVFKFPKDPSKDFIKRCIAVPGQQVEIRDKAVYVDGIQQIPPSHSKFIDPTVYTPDSNPDFSMSRRDNYPKFIVPENSYFMMGDNRDNSNDSRFWGYVPYENIKGKALIIYWSWDSKASLLKKIRWNRFFRLIL